jgi:hypothetical protein
MPPEWLMQAVLTGGIAAVGAWGAVRVTLAHMRRAINAAHRRLDIIGAPPADLPVLPD